MDNRFLRAYQEYQLEKQQQRPISPSLKYNEPSRFDCLKDEFYVPREQRQRPRTSPLRRRKKPMIAPLNKDDFPKLPAAICSPLSSPQALSSQKRPRVPRSPPKANCRAAKSLPKSSTKLTKPVPPFVSLRLGPNGVTTKAVSLTSTYDQVTPVIQGRTWAEVCCDSNTTSISIPEKN